MFRVVNTYSVNLQVMTIPELKSMWLGEVNGMPDRIISMRSQLRDDLAAYITVSQKNESVNDAMNGYLFIRFKPRLEAHQ